MNCGGVILLPEARKLEKADVQTEEIKQNGTVKTRNRELAAWVPGGGQLLVLVPLRGAVFPALGMHEGILHS